MNSEQTEALNSLLNGYNVVIDSIPGSGKTHCIVSALKYFYFDRVSDNTYYDVLVLTYNNRLRYETIKKVSAFTDTPESVIKHIIHTFHSYVNTKYECRNDIDIESYLSLPQENDKSDTPRGCLLVLDEAQDMTDLYFRLVNNIIEEMYTLNNTYPILFMLGDTKQAIYDFKGADIRYLANTESLWPRGQWKRFVFETTYRIAPGVVDIINDIFSTNIVAALKTQAKANVITIPGSKFVDFIVSNIKTNAKSVFILSSSVRGNTIISTIAKELTKHRITNTILDDDSTPGDINPGVVLCSYHRSKGLERETVFVLMEQAGESLPNSLYVALTRSMKNLYILLDSSKSIPYYLQNTKITKYLTRSNIKYEELSEVLLRKLSIQPVIKDIPGVLRFLPIEIIRAVTSIKIDKSPGISNSPGTNLSEKIVDIIFNKNAWIKKLPPPETGPEFLYFKNITSKKQIEIADAVQLYCKISDIKPRGAEIFNNFNPGDYKSVAFETYLPPGDVYIRSNVYVKNNIIYHFKVSERIEYIDVLFGLILLFGMNYKLEKDTFVTTKIDLNFEMTSGVYKNLRCVKYTIPGGDIKNIKIIAKNSEVELTLSFYDLDENSKISLIKSWYNNIKRQIANPKKIGNIEKVVILNIRTQESWSFREPDNLIELISFAK